LYHFDIRHKQKIHFLGTKSPFSYRRWKWSWY